MSPPWYQNPVKKPVVDSPEIPAENAHFWLSGSGVDAPSKLAASGLMSNVVPRPLGGMKPPLCDIPSGCCFFTGPWKITCCSLRMLCQVAAVCRPLPPVVWISWNRTAAGMAARHRTALGAL